MVLSSVVERVNVVRDLSEFCTVPVLQRDDQVPTYWANGFVVVGDDSLPLPPAPPQAVNKNAVKKQSPMRSATVVLLFLRGYVCSFF